jgi:hypothetical protein
MNIKSTAKQIMSAMQSDAFNQEACVKILRDAQEPQSNDELAERLCRAWAKYVQLFTEPPHGIFKQIRAMLEFMP